ncbi:MAG: hypothetical protein AAFO06_10700 [Cyanobacteria bacterium J06597_16]
MVTTFLIGMAVFSSAPGAFASNASDTFLASTSLPSNTNTLLAYNIDYGMDQARGEQTLEYYEDDEDFGDKLREIIERTLRNNENHPESKETAKNSYKRESALNNILPEKRSSAFSKDDLSKLRKTQNPKDLLR